MFNSREIGADEHELWFRNAVTDQSHYLMIVEEEVPFGFVQFRNVDEKKTAEWGFYVDPKAEKGSGKKLGNLALEYAFTVLKLHKVCGQAIASNTGSIHLHEYLGFTKEGVLRDQRVINQQYQSVISFRLLEYEWRQLKKHEN